jgi:ribosomal-protein-alanine N-acetyltransferase
VVGSLEIRRMTERDIESVWRIERDLFSMPWSKPSFLYEVSDSRISYTVVGVEDGTVAGYAIAWFVNDEVHIGNMAIARDRQGRGLGKRLLEHLLEVAVARKMKYATLEVRVSNVRAIRLYRNHGFRGVALHRGYYSDNGEDALVMLAELDFGDEPEAGDARTGGC